MRSRPREYDITYPLVHILRYTPHKNFNNVPELYNGINLHQKPKISYKLVINITITSSHDVYGWYAMTGKIKIRSKIYTSYGWFLCNPNWSKNQHTKNGHNNNKFADKRSYCNKIQNWPDNILLTPITSTIPEYMGQTERYKERSKKEINWKSKLFYQYNEKSSNNK